MQMSFNRLVISFVKSFRDIIPIILVVLFFQLVVLQAPLPNVAPIIIGLLMVVLGLSFFILGLELGLFPIGESMADAFAKKGNVWWLLIFSFCLGFGTTVAEPALIAVAAKAASIAAQTGHIPADLIAQNEYAASLRLCVALAVGVAIVIGVMRILRGWPIHIIIMGGYAMVIILTGFAPAEIIGIAYDSGGVTTSTITVPLVTALGVGLAASIKGRNPMIDGFGLIAFASLTPIIFVLLFGILY